MLGRLIALAVIIGGAAMAWFILAGTLAQRTLRADASQRARLAAQWGAPQVQSAPRIIAGIPGAGRGSWVPLNVERSDITVGIDLLQRRLGLLWYNLYDVSFSGHYVVRNTTPARELSIYFSLPSSTATYADLSCRVDGASADPAPIMNGGPLSVRVRPGQAASIDVAYRSHGTESWNYRFGPSDGVHSVSNFSLTMLTNFEAIDYPPDTMFPESEVRAGNGWRLTWTYKSLVTSNGIGMVAPYPMQPGPLAVRVTLWAPVCLLFYVFVTLMIATLREIDLHPVNYFFLACAFFSFHLLFAYLVDRIPLGWAFVVCSLVSMGLTVSYLRLVVGMRFAAVESGLAQAVYLVLFTYALFDEGWSGLTITIGAIVTLFVAMQLTARIRWSERFARPS